MPSSIVQNNKENNQNYNVIIFSLLASFIIIPTMTMNMILPILPNLADTLGAPTNMIAAPITIYLAGLAFFQLIIGPLSDRIGRRGPLISGLISLLIGSIICATAHNFHILLIGRAVQAFGTAALISVGRASVSDIYEPNKTAQCFSTIMLFAGFEPMITPIIGAKLLEFGGWQSLFWLFSIIAAFVLVATMIFFKECRSKAARIEAAKAHPVKVYISLLSNIKLFGFLIICVSSLIAFFAYMAVAPLVTMKVYGLNPNQYSILASFNAIAMAIGGQLNRFLLNKYQPSAIMAKARFLFLGFGILAAIFAISLFGGLWFLVALMFLSTIAISLIQANSLACAFAIVPEQAGTIAAIFGAIAFAIGAITTFITGNLYDGTAHSLGIMISFGLILTSVLIFIFLKPAKV